ncbi:MAG: MerR family transcriptional regulator [Chlorobi bacterium]|nr:MerR family transcriptional regulator [Chlorobiota bacterium]
MDFKVDREEPVFSISTAAKLLGISIPTLRMYEKEGLILPFKKESHQRLYSEADLERIRCIREAINQKKISINGIKAIYSLIPCWEVVHCSEEDRKICGAFNGDEEPCWTYNHPNTVCENIECRDCIVYKNYSKCGTIKDLLKNITGKEI